MLHGSIGDVTRALPLAAWLRKGYPNAFIAWSVEPAAYALLQGNGAIDEVILFDRGRWRHSSLAFLHQVRAHGFDLVLDLQRHLKSGLIGWLSRAPQRVGFHRKDSKELNWLFNNFHIPFFGDKISKLEHYLKFGDFIGLEAAPLVWDFGLSEVEHRAVESQLATLQRPFAVLFVGTRWQSKNWFPEQIAACAELLRDEFQHEVVLLGATADQEAAAKALAAAQVPLLDLTGRTSLREAIGIIQRAKVAIGPDTGLMHVAAALRVPVISLWGATEPERTGPYGFGDLAIKGQAPCSPCYRRNCNIGRLCMQSITSEQIGAKLGLALGRGRAEQVRHAECG